MALRPVPVRAMGDRRLVEWLSLMRAAQTKSKSTPGSGGWHQIADFARQTVEKALQRRQS